MNIVCLKKELRVRILLLISVVMYSVGMLGVGWTPTDAGLVVNLEQGERFLLSVMVSGDFDNNPATPNTEREFFVNNYNRYEGSYFGYMAGGLSFESR